ncbi:hypothetical protein AC578_4834 [Pseudocercospora eumusae]|uniref:Uncharacterized protein n=1 Tax=Pseudocercospora eumusae TaxID=321146 RepID=A0A139HL67_9PEZI|nr:hypothetical protein AC578_4834 [Pseudocercospora eumusae]
MWPNELVASVLEQSGVEFPYNSLFDPAVLPNQFDISFNPADSRPVLNNNVEKFKSLKPDWNPHHRNAYMNNLTRASADGLDRSFT